MKNSRAPEANPSVYFTKNMTLSKQKTGAQALLCLYLNLQPHHLPHQLTKRIRSAFILL